MSEFLGDWQHAAQTSVGFFWMALWAFALGYLISSLIQVLVTRQRMQRAMGTVGPRSMALGTFFGFISSSCSFAALSATRALFQKGSGLAPSMAFLLASTNLVIELGIVIAMFLGWQFVVGEYLGGILLILFAWLFIRVTRPQRMIDRARERLGGNGDEHEDDEGADDWRQKVESLGGWQQIGETYVMEWQMVWKDVLIGFTVAGVIAAFVPDSFFAFLFPGSGGNADTELSFWQVAAQTVIGPVAAFCTFIGSMGNIPLAALLFDRGVSFAGVMAFIFSDLVVLPVLRINAAYYGWRMALYILAMLLSGLVVVALTLHYGFDLFGFLPERGAVKVSPSDREFFEFDYGFVLNLVFLLASAVLVGLAWRGRRESDDDSGHEHHGHDDGGGGHDHDHGGGGSSVTEWILRAFALAALLWLFGGLLIPPLAG